MVQYFSRLFAGWQRTGLEEKTRHLLRKISKVFSTHARRHDGMLLLIIGSLRIGC